MFQLAATERLVESVDSFYVGTRGKNDNELRRLCSIRAKNSEIEACRAFCLLKDEHRLPHREVRGEYHFEEP